MSPSGVEPRPAWPPSPFARGRLNCFVAMVTISPHTRRQRIRLPACSVLILRSCAFTHCSVRLGIDHLCRYGGFLPLWALALSDCVRGGAGDAECLGNTSSRDNRSCFGQALHRAARSTGCNVLFAVLPSPPPRRGVGHPPPTGDPRATPSGCRIGSGMEFLVGRSRFDGLSRDNGDRVSGQAARAPGRGAPHPRPVPRRNGAFAPCA